MDPQTRLFEPASNSSAIDCSGVVPHSTSSKSCIPRHLKPVRDARRRRQHTEFHRPANGKPRSRGRCGGCAASRSCRGTLVDSCGYSLDRRWTGGVYSRSLRRAQPIAISGVGRTKTGGKTFSRAQTRSVPGSRPMRVPWRRTIFPTHNKRTGASASVLMGNAVPRYSTASPMGNLALAANRTPDELRFLVSSSLLTVNEPTRISFIGNLNSNRRAFRCSIT